MVYFKKNIILILFLLIIPLSTAQSTFTLIDTYTDTTCGDVYQGMTINTDLERIYLIQRDSGGATNLKIQAVDNSNPNNLVAKSCTDLGIPQPSFTINTGRSIIVGGYVYLGYNSGGAGSGGKLFNLSSTGNILTQSYQAPIATGDFLEIQDIENTEGNSVYGCVQSNRGLELIDLDTGTTDTILTGIANPCRALTKIFSANGLNAIILDSTNISVFNANSGLITQSIIGNGDAGVATRDAIDVFNNERVLAQMGLLTLWEFDDVTRTITQTDNASNILLGQGGVEIISNDTFIVVGKNNTDEIVTILEYVYDNTGDFNLIQNFSTGLSQSPTGNFITEYIFPNLYVMFPNGTDSNYLFVYEFFPTGFQAGENIKPEIGAITPTTTRPAVLQPITIDYTSINPETNTINEQILTIGKCEYTETTLREETFDTGFNFTSFCGSSTSIGAKNGVDYGLGLTLSSCDNDNLLLAQSSLTNVIMSFDLYATTNGTTEFELLEFDGDVIANLLITHDNNSNYQVTDKTNTILGNISSLRSGINIPIRFFFQISPNTNNENIKGRVFYSTNYFSRADTNNIEETFCDTTERCYIGDFSTDATFINDYFALRIVNSTGNTALDNYKVVSIDEYTPYTATTSLTNNYECLYEQQGTFTTRTYLSDVTYGHNYLSYEDLTMIVTLIGVPANATTPINTSIVESINLLASIGGVTDSATRQVMAWLIIIILLIIGLLAGHALMGTVGSIAFFAFFLVIGWIPVIWLVLVIILGSAFVAIFARRTISGVA